MRNSGEYLTHFPARLNYTLNKSRNWTDTMDDLAHQFSFAEMLWDSLYQEKIVELELRLATCAGLLAGSRRIPDQSANVRRI